jgi:superfamily II DNA/RNA helicase
MGDLDVGAVKALAPHMFDGVPADQHEAIAHELGKSAGLLRNAAERSIIYDHPQAAGLDRVAQEAAKRKGKPGVVFATSRRAVENLRARLEAEGHRVVTITGSDSSAEKAAKIQAFNPDSGERKADIVVCSDAAATGANLQSGNWLVNYDTPDTAMVHAQRQGRINRIGQKNAIELIDHVPRHASVAKARERLAKKYVLRELMTSPLEGMDDTGLASFLHAQKVDEEQGALF